MLIEDSYSTPDNHTLHVQQLFVRHQQAILGCALSIEPIIADAEEIVQEVFRWSAGRREIGRRGRSDQIAGVPARF